MAMIELESVSKWFGSFQVLNDVNLQVQNGERIVVCGHSVVVSRRSFVVSMRSNPIRGAASRWGEPS